MGIVKHQLAFALKSFVTSMAGNRVNSVMDSHIVYEGESSLSARIRVERVGYKTKHFEFRLVEHGG